MMKLMAVGMLGLFAVVGQAETDEEFEARLREAVAGDGVTVVHLWASWCINCINEHENDGWKNFIESNPEVTVIFVSLWSSKRDDQAVLAKFGLADQPNLQIWRHPNQSGRESERVAKLLDLPLTWVPTTWVLREGRLRYALNYGEARFEMLQQMVKDSVRGQW